MSFVGSRRALLTTGITSSDPDVQAWINALGGPTTTLTNQNEVNALTTFVVGDKADGNWAKRDRLWLYMLGTASAAAIDLVTRSSHSLVNNPTFAALQGFTGNGSNARIDTGYNPVTNGVNQTASSATQAPARNGAFEPNTAYNGPDAKGPITRARLLLDW